MKHDNDKPIGIPELIGKVKAELLKSQGDDPLFVIREVELEITFAVERSAQGGINVYVLESGVGKTWGETQTVKIRLETLVDKEAVVEQMTPQQRQQAARAATRTSHID